METVNRGYEPKDAVEFGLNFSEKLTNAAQELYFLLNRGYDVKSSSTFIGNHYLLSERQRMALARIISPESSIQNRSEKELKKAPKTLTFDGFNTIITLEVALSGSLLIKGMDNTIRDLAGLRGTYRIIDKTHQAVELLFQQLDLLQVEHALFYLDKQVSNSGRLKSLLLEQSEKHSTQIEVELHPQVDSQLFPLEYVVTSDAIILDKCKSWYNFNRGLIQDFIPNAWIFEIEP